MDKEKKHIPKINIPPVVRALICVVVFILALTSLTYMIRMNGDTKDRFMGFYAEPKDSLDIVMIGSSPTYSSCVTPQLYGEYGIKAYPLASNVQRPVAGVYLVKEAQKTQSPKLYMFEMRMYVGIEEGLISNMAYTREVTDNMKYSFNRIDTINAMTSGMVADLGYADALYTYYFDIFKYHSNWKSLIHKEQCQSWRYTRRSAVKGYKITDKVGPIEKPAIDTDAEPAKLDKYQEEALQNLLTYLRDNNLNALFYVSPYKPAEGDAGKLAYIKETVQAAGYDYLDMNQYVDDIDLEYDRDFSDYGIHTNASGARKCTDFLGKYLRDNYELNDFRIMDADGDTVAGYQDNDDTWEQAYRDWLEAYSEAESLIDEHIANEDYFVLEE